MFSQINIVPRWIIFCLDLLVCIFSLGFAYFLRYNFNITEINSAEFSRNILLFTLVNSIVFLAVKTYSGIIRYTSAQDSFRILFSIIISNGFFFFANLMLVSFSVINLILILIFFEIIFSSLK